METKLIKIGVWVTILGVLFAIGPLVCALLAGSIASHAGCELNEGIVNSCTFFGLEIGGLLYSLGVLGWLGLISLPIGGLVAILGVITLIIGTFGKIFKRKN